MVVPALQPQALTLNVVEDVVLATILSFQYTHWILLAAALLPHFAYIALAVESWNIANARLFPSELVRSKLASISNTLAADLGVIA